MISPQLKDFIRDIPQDGKILDVGCGSGKTLRLIKELRPDLELFAIDWEDIKSRIPKEVRFTVGSVEELKVHYQRGLFDAVICQHVIEHLIYPTKLIESINFVLKKEGTVFIETPNWTRLFIPFSKNFFWNDYTHIRPFSKYALTQLVEHYGFSVSVVKTVSSLLGESFRFSPSFIFGRTIKDVLMLSAKKHKDNGQS
jgi:2-polyprenyl-3-methyl-5-hydroxy-6-metoxy-1,4-benzoquinol methylase